MVVIDPKARPSDRVCVFSSIAQGCRILTAMRADRGLSQPKKRKAA